MPRIAASLSVVGLAVVLLLGGCVSRDALEQEPPVVAPRDGDWKLWKSGALASVHVGRALYASPGSPHFLVRVRIVNGTDRRLGVDLRDGDRVVYPNQWGTLDEPRRGGIDEERIIPLRVDEATRARIVTDLDAGALTTIAPGAAVDYFRAFDASGPDDVAAAGGRFVYVSMDGQLLVTDGRVVESIDGSWGDDDLAEGDLILPTPVAFAPLPPGALVIDR